MPEETGIAAWLMEELNLILMIIFIFFYSVLVFFNSSQSRLANFCRNVTYMSSGLLFTYYVFQLSYLEDYIEFEYLIAFLLALSFRDLLPILVRTVVDISTAKLQQLDDKIKGSG